MRGSPVKLRLQQLTQSGADVAAVTSKAKATEGWIDIVVHERLGWQYVAGLCKGKLFEGDGIVGRWVGVAGGARTYYTYPLSNYQTTFHILVWLETLHLETRLAPR